MTTPKTTTNSTTAKRVVYDNWKTIDLSKSKNKKAEAEPTEKPKSSRRVMDFSDTTFHVPKQKKAAKTSTQKKPAANRSQSRGRWLARNQKKAGSARTSPQITITVGRPRIYRSGHVVRPGEVARVKFQPSQFTVHAGWKKTAIAGAIRGNKLDLNRLTPQMINRLTPDQRKILFRGLGRVKVKMEAFTKSGKRLSGGWFRNTSKVNATAALGFKLWAGGHTSAFTKVFAAAPNKLVQHIRGRSARILLGTNIGMVFKEMSASGKKLTTGELNGLGSLVKQYLQSHKVGTNPARLRAAVAHLLKSIQKSGIKFTAQAAGDLTGAVLGGVMKHLNAIKASAEERKSLVNGIFDSAGILAGVAGPWGSAISAGLTALKTVYNEMDKPTDRAGFAQKLRAELERGWLDLAKNKKLPGKWTAQDILYAVAYFNSAIRANGVN